MSDIDAAIRIARRILVMGDEMSDEDFDCDDVDFLCKGVVALETRRDDLLALIARISQTTPLDSEIADAIAQRGAMLAEIGTLRAQNKEFHRAWFGIDGELTPEMLSKERDAAEAITLELATAEIVNGRLLAELAEHYPVSITGRALCADEAKMSDLREIIDAIGNAEPAARLTYLPERLRGTGG